MMDASEYARFRKEIAEENGLAVDPAYQHPEALGKGTDWYDVLFRPAAIQNYSLSYSNGDGKFKSSTVASYFNQDGVLTNSNYQRFSALAAFDKPRKQADFPGLAGTLPGFQLVLHDVKALAVNNRLMPFLHHNPVLRLFFPDGADFEAVVLLLGSDSPGIDGIHQDVLDYRKIPHIPPVYRVFLFPFSADRKSTRLNSSHNA